MEFDNVPVDGSTKFIDDMMDSIEPFDYKDLEDFDVSYLSGFLSESYDIDKELASTRMKKRVENTMIEELKKTVKAYSSVNLTNTDINLNIGETEYMLLPVWMLNIKYNDKNYLFAMNGQTGKMIGDVPAVVSRVLIITGIVFVILFIIFSIIDTFFI